MIWRFLGIIDHFDDSGYAILNFYIIKLVYRYHLHPTSEDPFNICGISCRVIGGEEPPFLSTALTIQSAATFT